MSRPMKDSGIDWIGEIPQEWVTCHIKSIASIYTGNSIKDEEKEKYEDSENAIPYVSSKDVNATFQTVNYENGMFVKKEDLSFKRAPSNSILLCIEGGSAGKKIAYIDRDICFVNKLCCFHSDYQNNKFLYYFMMSPAFTIPFASHISGLIGGVSVGELKNFVYTLPTLDEQKRIADFLDRKSAEIDTVIKKTEESIEEYKKLKQSIITEAVTKGIRPGRKTKPSGIEWIGDIPEEWNIVRIKTLFDYRNERNDKPLEEVNLISLYTDKGVVQHSDLEETTGNKASNADGYKLVYENDIVVNIILCWMGAIGRSAYNGVTSPAYDVYSPKKNTNSKYYHHLFRTTGFNGDCYKYGRGIMMMRWRTYSDEFRALKVVCPPSDEQKEIVDFLDRKSTEIDKLIEAKQKIVEEMQTYKKSVIYEYVTGKKEVPNC